MLKRSDGNPVHGKLVYRLSEHSFDVEPKPECGVTSLLVNDVQIEIEENGRLIYVWGLCPQESWRAAILNAPAARRGCLHFVREDVVPGVSKRINADGRWNVVHDSSSRWVCLGDELAEGEATAFAPGAIAVLRGTELVALWLLPEVRE